MKNHTFSLIVFFLCAAFTLVFAETLSASVIESEHILKTHFYTEDSFQPEELKPGSVYARDLRGGEKNFYTVYAEAGTCLRFVIDQKGIDVMIGVKNAEGKSIKEVDRPSGGFGRETVTLIVPESGIYAIEIKAWLADAIVGSYQISYSIASSPTGDDLRRSLGENLTSEAETLRAAGSRDSRERALQKFAEAFELWEQLADLYEQAVVYYGMGFTNYGLSNYYEAARLYNRALQLHLQTGDEFGQAVNHSALGSVEYALNENEFAAYNYKKAIELYKKAGNVRGLGIAFHGLGTTQLLSENYNDAIVNLSESLKFRALANDSSGKARTHITLGKLYLSLNSYEKAERQLIEARNSLGENRAGKDAELLYHFGRLFLLTGKLTGARKFLEQSLIFSREAGNKIGEAHALADLSRADVQSGDLSAGIENIQIALDLIEQLRQATFDYRTRVNFFATVQPFYEQYILLLMKMHEREPNKCFDRKALEINEQAQSRGLLDRLERRRQIKQGKIESNLIEREQQLRDLMTEVLANEQQKTPLQLAERIQTISAQFIEVESEINRKSSSSIKSITLPTLSVERIQQYLDENTVLLEYAFIGDESFLWFVSNREVKSFRLLSGRPIEPDARLIFDCVSKPPQPRNEGNCRRTINALSETLLRPVAKHLRNKRLVIVRPGFLQYIPFASLYNPVNQDYLIKTNEIVNLPSASVLSFIQRTDDKAAPNKTLAIFGDPIFSATDERVNKIKNTPVPKIPGNGDGGFTRLFASRFEVKSISAFVPPEKLLVKTDAAANRAMLFNSNLSDYRILHFATHALVDDQQPERSAVVLSLFDENGNTLNGFFRSNDILRLDLAADLVVLSACRSGAGKQIKGEGILSLANSFFSAGAGRLITSLWEVDDKVTAEFMKRFYRKHLKENKSFSTSLREAQIEIMSDKRWTSPFHWASFSLQGGSEFISH